MWKESFLDRKEKKKTHYFSTLVRVDGFCCSDILQKLE